MDSYRRLGLIRILKEPEKPLTQATNMESHIQAIAYSIYEYRKLSGMSGTPEEDWILAESIVNNKVLGGGSSL
jgi:hypothetical protein